MVEEVYSSFWVMDRAMKNVKIERAMGPQISMASSGWGYTSTNQKATVLLGYTWDENARRAITMGEDAVPLFCPSN